MHKPIEIQVIGTEPPCPRCDLLSVLVEEVVRHDTRVRLRHCSFDSPEAAELGLKLGRKVGTAKHIAMEAGIPMDWDAVYSLIDQNKPAARSVSRPADSWTPDLDGMLEPCRKAAEAAGYLMTPILVVNGKVVHHGNLPSKHQIQEWLSEQGL